MVGVCLVFLASSLLLRTFLEDTREMPRLKCLKAKVFPGFTRVPCRTLGPHPPIPFLNFYTHTHTHTHTPLYPLYWKQSASILNSSASLISESHLQARRFPSWTPLEMLSSSSHLSIYTLPTLEDNTKCSRICFHLLQEAFQALSSLQKTLPHTHCCFHQSQGN